MLERHDLSIKNNWSDDNGDIFIYYTRAKMQSDISKSDKTVTKAINELKSFGLIEEKQQGLSMPNKIYLLAPALTPTAINEILPNEETSPANPANITDTENLRVKTRNNSVSRHAPANNEKKVPANPVNITDTENLRVKTRNNSESRPVKTPYQDTENLRPNKTNINKTKENKTKDKNTHYLKFRHVSHVASTPLPDAGPTDRLDGQDMTIVTAAESTSMPTLSFKAKASGHTQKKKNPPNATTMAANIASYENLIKDNIGYTEFRYTDIELVDNFVAVIIDTVFTTAEMIHIGKEQKSSSVVKSVFCKLNHRDIQHAIDQFNNVTTRITNKSKYIRTLLYNCKLEGDAHYTNAYNVGKYN